MQVAMGQGQGPLPEEGGQGDAPPAEEAALPLFRKDLELYRTPDEPDGSPTYSLFDPVTAQFFKITWAEATLLRCLRPGMKASELIEKVARSTTMRVTAEEIQMFFEQAKRINLLSIPKTAQELKEEVDKKKVHPVKWLLFHYLYFRVPLFNPDNFLEKTLPLARLFIHPLAFVFYFIFSFLGMVLLLGRLDEFLYTFPYFLQ